MKKISILIPCYNEEKSLPLLYPELVKLMDGNPAYEWELMFVNDGSRDDTSSASTTWTCHATSARRMPCWRALTM